MLLTEALTITALGLSIVFTGLVLCVVFILLLERVARNITWEGLPVHGAPGPAPVPDTASGQDAPSAPVPPDVLAVIVAVLEVERALYVGRYRSRLTLTRPSRPAAMTEPS